MKQLIIILFLISIVNYIYGQQQPVFNQYMLTPYIVNPAVAGSEGYTEFSLVSRKEMLNLPYSPLTNLIAFQNRVMKSDYKIIRKPSGNAKYKNGHSGRVGYGGYIYNDRNGATDRIGIQGTYAYHIFIENTQLSFGLSMNLNQFRIIPDLVTLKDDNDKLMSKLGESMYMPDANLGVYVRGLDYWAGFSVTQIMQSFLKFGSGSADYDSYKMFRHYYVTAGYDYESIGSSTRIQPSFLFTTTEFLQMQLDLNLKLLFNEHHWTGLIIRSNKSVGLLAGTKFKKAYIGYAFDYTFNNLRSFNYGSHELLCSFKFGENARRYKWMKRF